MPSLTTSRAAGRRKRMHSYQTGSRHNESERKTALRKIGLCGLGIRTIFDQLGVYREELQIRGSTPKSSFICKNRFRANCRLTEKQVICTMPGDKKAFVPKNSRRVPAVMPMPCDFSARLSSFAFLVGRGTVEARHRNIEKPQINPELCPVVDHVA